MEVPAGSARHFRESFRTQSRPTRAYIVPMAGKPSKRDKPLNDLSGPALPEVSTAKFFVETPPGKKVVVEVDAHNAGTDFSGAQLSWHLPDIPIHCTSSICDGGIRAFRSQTDSRFRLGESNTYLRFECRNCDQSTKTYSIWMFAPEPFGNMIQCMKYGEFPSFGPPPSPQLNALVESEREHFLQGRRCEMQGLGIGAFTYYRRVVLGVKDRLLDRMIAACQKLPSTEVAVQDLKRAKTIREFTRATETFSAALPDSLLLNGQNPLTLLHNALSVGIHALSDHECLEQATAVRNVLDELAGRLAVALRDDKELNASISRLAKMPSDARKKNTAPDTAATRAKRSNHSQTAK